MCIGETQGRMGLSVPPAVKVEALAAHRARLTLEPLARGFGTTLGAALRQVLLSSLPGCAATQVSGALTAPLPPLPAGDDPGLWPLLHRLSGVVFRLQDRQHASLTLRAEGAGPVCAGDILVPRGVEVLNPAHVLAQLGPGARLDLQIQVERGCGHAPGDLHHGAGEPAPRGPTFRLGACFSPVRRVTCRVEPTRSPQRADLDRLVLDIETDGAITPCEALDQGARLLMAPAAPVATSRTDKPVEPDAEPDEAWRRALEAAGLLQPIDELGLSLRTSRSLKAENIRQVADLVPYTEAALLRTPNLGRKGLLEIKAALAALGLTLGTRLAAATDRPRRRQD